MNGYAQPRFLILHYNDEVRCPECATIIARPHSLSYVVDASGEVVVARTQYPFPLQFSVQCECGHRVELPGENPFLHDSTAEGPSDEERRLAVTLETPLSK